MWRPCLPTVKYFCQEIYGLMIEIHERLSEFSYGYGVTKEVESAVRAIGIKTVPFLPSLVQEKKIACDVKLDGPGKLILLQFKLGQQLRRFVRPKGTTRLPSVERPFWRFKLDTAEPEGQYETLLRAEIEGADAYYVAPRFVDWSEYLEYFEANSVVENSILLRPSEIRNALVAAGVPDGPHKVLYDGYKMNVCSEPLEIRGASFRDLVESATSSSEAHLTGLLGRVFSGLSHRSQVRRPRETMEQEEDEKPFDVVSHRRFDANERRLQRLAVLRERSATEGDAFAAAVGVEMWSLGIQTILVGKARNGS